MSLLPIETLTPSQQRVQQQRIGVELGVDVAQYNERMELPAGAQMVAVVAFKGIALRTSGANGVIATVQLPAWLTRWTPDYSSGVGYAFRVIVESGTSDLSGVSLKLQDDTADITAAATLSAYNGSNPTFEYPDGLVLSLKKLCTGSQLHLYQTGNAPGAATVSAYLPLVPLV